MWCKARQTKFHGRQRSGNLPNAKVQRPPGQPFLPRGREIPPIPLPAIPFITFKTPAQSLFSQAGLHAGRSQGLSSEAGKGRSAQLECGTQVGGWGGVGGKEQQRGRWCSKRQRGSTGRGGVRERATGGGGYVAGQRLRHHKAWHARQQAASTFVGKRSRGVGGGGAHGQSRRAWHGRQGPQGEPGAQKMGTEDGACWAGLAWQEVLW